jgi:hypothetical protein
MYRTAFCPALALLVLTLASRALASEPYPDTIRDHLMLAQAPTCIICHETLIGGLMTVNKPFGRALQQKYGLRFLDVPGLRDALTRMQREGHDSDGDGTSDIAELLQGQDPNSPGEGGVIVTDEPRYGCYCSAVGRASASATAGAAWLSGLLLSIGRRRRTTRRRGTRKT